MAQGGALDSPEYITGDTKNDPFFICGGSLRMPNIKKGHFFAFPVVYSAWPRDEHWTFQNTLQGIQKIILS